MDMPDVDDVPYTQWWARIKYVENFVDCVEVSQISECDHNLRITQPFRPTHLKDFDSNKLYIVQTNKFNRDEDDKINTYYALIGNLAESKDYPMESSEIIKWPEMLIDDSVMSEGISVHCGEIQVNIGIRFKTSKLCCVLQGIDQYPLITLLSEFERDKNTLVISIQQQLDLATSKIKKLKKRLCTDIYVYNPSYNDPLLPSLRSSLMGHFVPIETNKLRLVVKSLQTSAEMEDVLETIERWQLLNFPIPSFVIVLIKLYVRMLRTIEKGLLDLDCSLVELTECLTRVEERLIDLYIDLDTDNIVTNEENGALPEDIFSSDDSDDSDASSDEESSTD